MFKNRQPTAAWPKKIYKAKIQKKKFEWETLGTTVCTPLGAG